MNMLSAGYVKSTVNNGICTIRFFHPQGNSLPAGLMLELKNTITEAGENMEVKLLVLASGNDDIFCAGASFDELAAITNEQEGLAFFSGFAHLINAVRKCPKLVLGRINGKCAGGGVGLAAACDYAIATNNASVKLSELAIGIGPFVIGPAVERKIGKASFAQLAINARQWQTASWAFEKGLYASLHDDEASMDAALEKLASQLVTSNPEATAAIKAMLWEGTDHWDELLIQRASISGRLVLSEFTRNAIRSFKNKSRE
jgi:methylglutaconyl-CoA hydratase